MDLYAAFLLQESLLKLSKVDLAIIVVYFAAVLATGYYLKRHTRTGEDFLLAGREMTAWVAGLSSLAANLGSLDMDQAVFAWDGPRRWTRSQPTGRPRIPRWDSDGASKRRGGVDLEPGQAGTTKQERSPLRAPGFHDSGPRWPLSPLTRRPATRS